MGFGLITLTACSGSRMFGIQNEASSWGFGIYRICTNIYFKPWHMSAHEVENWSWIWFNWVLWVLAVRSSDISYVCSWFSIVCNFTFFLWILQYALTDIIGIRLDGEEGSGFVCLPGVSWLLCDSSSRCHGFVCSLWLWYLFSWSYPLLFLRSVYYYFLVVLITLVNKRRELSYRCLKT